MSGGRAAGSLLLLLAERGAQLAVVLHYFLTGQYLWAGWTLGLLLPGCLAQALSFVWFRRDGHPECFTLTLLHVLQLGILKRHVDCIRAALKGRGEEERGETELLMQHGDLSLLRLLEVLLQALPHLLLQSYIYLTLGQTDIYPVLSALLSLLSLSWALVLYSSFLCLLKPGHLSMPWAALLCQLLWRMGMIGTRVMALVVFARVYHFWVFAVGGAHWLVMCFWLVAQQTDVISRPCHWRWFNVLVGAVYVFCFINVRDGPSRYRVAIFYAVMLLENSILLLLATDFLQEAMWSNIKLSVAVMSGFLIGCAALIVYYTLLHPKSTEISQSFRKMAHVARVGKEKAEESAFSSGRWHGVQGREADGTFGIEDLKPKVQTGNGEMVADEELVTWMDTHEKSRRPWLLLKLAMKTGNLSKINAAFGDGGFGNILLPGGLEDAQNSRHLLGKKYPMCADNGKLEPVNPVGILESERWLMEKMQVEEHQDYEGSPHDSSTYVTFGNSPDRDKLGVNGGIAHGNIDEELNAAGSSSNRAEMPENATLYFSANTEGVVPSVRETKTVLVHGTGVKSPLGSSIKEITEQVQVKTEAFPAISVSPILGFAKNGNFQRSVAPDVGSLCNESSLSNNDSEIMESEDALGEKCHHLLTAGVLAPSNKGRLGLEEKPCFTSTPKPHPPSLELGLRESKARKKLAQLTEKA
ncbi:XK-related protein 5 [Ascaphus truei]|uniref:XK-related protein 5 n=1 Tax=Ascaphus truei TaxID=8439 RepID=UPI003F59C7BB